MHSKIFQISSSPIKDEDLIREERYYDNFVGSIADYVSDLRKKEQKELHKYLIDDCMGLSVNKLSDSSFEIVSPEDYFRGKHKTFLNVLDTLKDVSLEQFSRNDYRFTQKNQLGYEYQSSISNLFAELNEAFEDRYDFYVDDSATDYYYGLVPLDYFMRRVPKGSKVYLGSVIDYHF